MKTLMTALALAALPVAALAAPMPASTFMMKAGASDKYEIESSKLVMTSTNPKVKEFAEGMVRDHTKSTADVKLAATKAKLKVPPPKLDAKGAKNVAELKAVSGTARDQRYIEQQKMAHQEALMLHQTNAASGTAAPLRAVSAKIVPVVEHHIEMLNAM